MREVRHWQAKYQDKQKEPEAYKDLVSQLEGD
jgi:hypothetical protein